MSKLTIEIDGNLSANVLVKVDDEVIGFIQSIDVSASAKDLLNYIRVEMIDPDTYPKDSNAYNYEADSVKKLQSLGFVHVLLKPLDWFATKIEDNCEIHSVVKTNSFDIEKARLEGNEIKYDDSEEKSEK